MSILTTLNPYVTYIKIAGVLAAVAVGSAAGFYFGGLGPKAEVAQAKTALATYKTAVEAQHAEQLQAVADDYRKQLAAAATSALAQQGIIDDLHKKLATPDPSTAGLAQQLLDTQAAAAAAASASCGGMPKAGTVAGGNAPAAGVPRGDPEAVRLLQGVFDAGSRDAKRLSAAQALAPQNRPLLP